LLTSDLWAFGVQSGFVPAAKNLDNEKSPIMAVSHSQNSGWNVTCLALTHVVGRLMRDGAVWLCWQQQDLNQGCGAAGGRLTGGRLVLPVLEGKYKIPRNQCFQR